MEQNKDGRFIMLLKKWGRSEKEKLCVDTPIKTTLQRESRNGIGHAPALISVPGKTATSGCVEMLIDSFAGY